MNMLVAGLVPALMLFPAAGFGLGLDVGVTETVHADNARPPRARTFEHPLIQFSEEDRERLEGTTSYEVPEVYELASVIANLTPYPVKCIDLLLYPSVA